ncbi:tripartite tricarboxylate transporter TctB family protein [Allonocardiopsis opalescens]|uniref:Putative tricarboxylic transport membrane protein n=1 Tax=Allonocardiopsis opalescens TaxID=1144618 RepID=A0A2T0QEG7_9ACTN|nr:tripartite tricarboxylate transporter TctB family protein [Allonocardiopsis opalescens]PRY02319.1 putative tricarboxylic transport membrane protein [Allonocardiopsis opalescens]
MSAEDGGTTGRGPDAPARPPLAVAPLATGVLVTAVGAVVLAGAFMIPESAAYQAVGAGAFPVLVGAGALVVGVLNLLAVLRRSDTAQLDQAREEAAVTHWPTVGALAAALAGYAALLVPLGFWQTSAVFLVVAARVLGSRRPVRDALVGLVLALALYFLFDRVLGVSLPPGYIRLAF